MNLLDEHRQATMDGVRLAGERGVGVIVMEPLRGGALDQDRARGGGRALRGLRPRPQPRRLGVPLSARPPGGDDDPLRHERIKEQLEENLRIFDAADVGCLSEEERKTLARVREAYEARTPHRLHGLRLLPGPARRA